MKRQRLLWVICFVVMTVLILSGISSVAVAASSRQLAIATASTGGSWYPAGGSIGSIITKYIPGTEASAHPSAASKENVRLLIKKNTDLAMLMPDVAYFAQSATDIYAGKAPAKIKGLFSFWGIDLLIITRADTDIHSIKDLKGHKVAFGRPGSGSENMSKRILGEYGITYKDLKAQFISAPEQAQALKDKNVDAAMYTIGTPASCFVDLCTLTKCRLVAIEPDMMKTLLQKYPFYTESVIPAGAYPQIDTETSALKWLGIVATYDDLDGNLAYNIVKEVCSSHLNEFHQSHAKAKNLTTETMFQGMSIPWHPGAAKFWKEKGLLK